jgi:tRNA(fMet)-specific endonuclease VapC
MIAFDTDVLSEILKGNQDLVRRANLVPRHEQAVPIVAVEEILRGRLNGIRQAEANKANLSVDQAYYLFERSLIHLGRLRFLPYTPEAEMVYQQWRGQKVRVGTQDLRIAAICVAQACTLISRNRRDFERIPGLLVEFWDQ